MSRFRSMMAMKEAKLTLSSYSQTVTAASGNIVIECYLDGEISNSSDIQVSYSGTAILNAYYSTSTGKVTVSYGSNTSTTKERTGSVVITYRSQRKYFYLTQSKDAVSKTSYHGFYNGAGCTLTSITYSQIGQTIYYADTPAPSHNGSTTDVVRFPTFSFVVNLSGCGIRATDTYYSGATSTREYFFSDGSISLTSGTSSLSYLWKEYNGNVRYRNSHSPNNIIPQGAYLPSNKYITMENGDVLYFQIEIVLCGDSWVGNGGSSSKWPVVSTSGYSTTNTIHVDTFETTVRGRNANGMALNGGNSMGSCSPIKGTNWGNLNPSDYAKIKCTITDTYVTFTNG